MKCTISMKLKITAFIYFQIVLCTIISSQIFGQVALPSFTPHSDTIHGIIVNDPYKAFENASNAEARQWIEKKNKEAVGYLSNKPSYAKLIDKITNMQRDTPIRASVPIVNNGKVYTIQTSSKDNVRKLIRMDTSLNSREVVLTSKTLTIDGTTYDMYDYNPSPDNRYLALQLYPIGLDDMVIRIYDTKTSTFTDDVIDKSISYYPFWLPDSKSFFLYST